MQSGQNQEQSSSGSALEADLNNEDIDVCIVSETHLKPQNAGCYRQHSWLFYFQTG